MPSISDRAIPSSRDWSVPFLSESWYNHLILEGKWEVLLRIGLYDDRVYHVLVQRHPDLWKASMMAALHLPLPVGALSAATPSSCAATSPSLPSSSSPLFAADQHPQQLPFLSSLWVKFIAHGMGYEAVRMPLSSHFTDLAEQLQQSAAVEKQSLPSEESGPAVALNTSKTTKGQAEVALQSTEKEPLPSYRTESVAALEDLVSQYGLFACASQPPSFSSSFLVEHAKLFTRMVQGRAFLLDSDGGVLSKRWWRRTSDAVVFAPSRTAVRLVTYACANMEKGLMQAPLSAISLRPPSPYRKREQRDAAKEDSVQMVPSLSSSSERIEARAYGDGSAMSSTPTATITSFCQEFPEFLEETNKIFCTSSSNDATAKRFAVFCLSLLSGTYYLGCRLDNALIDWPSAPFSSMSFPVKDPRDGEEWNGKRDDDPCVSPKSAKNAEKELYRVEAFTYTMRVMKPEAIAYGVTGWVYAFGRFWASTPSYGSNDGSGMGKHWPLPGWRGAQNEGGGARAVHNLGAFLSPAQRIRHRWITMLCRASLSAVICASCGVYSHSLLDWRRTQLLLASSSWEYRIPMKETDGDALFLSGMSDTNPTSTSCWNCDGVASRVRDIRRSQDVVRLQAITYTSTAVLLAATTCRLQSVSFPRWMGDVCFRFPWMARLFPAVVGLSPSSSTAFSVSSTKSLVPYVVAPFILVSWWRSDFFCKWHFVF